jgi:putative endonuclease
MSHFLYILYSDSRNRYYIGQTDNVESRLQYHNSGYVLSTKYGRPWKLVFSKSFADRSSAMKEETRLKNAKNRNYLLWYIQEFGLDEMK